MVTSRIALEELLQNRLTTDICKDTLRMQESAVNLFNLYAGKHHTDDTSSSSCCAEMITSATTKREAHTPTTDQSEDSGVDVSATAATDSANGRGRSYKRKRLDDDSDDGDGDGDECPSAAKSSRTAAAAAAVLSVNMASCPPFRPWSSDECSSDVGLRLFHDIRNVDRILTLTQRHRELQPPLPLPPPPPEPQPLDLTKDREGRNTDASHTENVVIATHAVVRLAARATATQTTERVIAQNTERVIAQAAPTTEPTRPTDVETIVSPARTACATGTTRYSKNMSRARRLEANARERSRVHTISAAFDTLRSAIPSYSRNQKLSKLSTIRIASAYILTLSRLLDMDYSAGQDAPSVDECVDNVTSIIHMEGKARKRRDEQ